MINVNRTVVSGKTGGWSSLHMVIWQCANEQCPIDIGTCCMAMVEWPLNNVQPGTGLTVAEGAPMEAAPSQKVAPSVSHETRVIAEFSTDFAGLADYLSAVAGDGDAEEMKLALHRAAAAIRLGATG
jgi:hypothetical protein